MTPPGVATSKPPDGHPWSHKPPGSLPEFPECCLRSPKALCARRLLISNPEATLSPVVDPDVVKPKSATILPAMTLPFKGARLFSPTTLPGRLRASGGVGGGVLGSLGPTKSRIGSLRPHHSGALPTAGGSRLGCRCGRRPRHRTGNGRVPALARRGCVVRRNRDSGCTRAPTFNLILPAP